MITRLTLVCPASTSAVRTAAFPADETLDHQGLSKIGAVTGRSLEADRCWTSPALSARQTAQALRLDAIVEPMLRECNYGRWIGRALNDVQAQEPEAIDEWMRDPAAAPHGGESILDLMDRIATWLDTQRGIPGRTIAVTQASVIRAAIVYAIEATPRSFWRIDVAPLSATRLNGNSGRWTLASIGPLIRSKKADGSE